MTIDDVIFSYYVLLDPCDSVSTLPPAALKGLKPIAAVWTLWEPDPLRRSDTYAANDFYTEKQYSAYWAAFNAAA